MTYTKNTWATGDTVTATKLNNMEDGIETANSLMIVEIEDINGTLTADHTFAEIFEAVNGGTLVFLYTKAQTDGDWAESYTARAQLLPVINAYKYDETYRIAASASYGPIDISGITYLFAPSILILQATGINNYPTFLRTVYPTNNSVSVVAS